MTFRQTSKTEDGLQIETIASSESRIPYMDDTSQPGRVANSDVGRRMGGTGPRFQTLLTSGRPKQTASSWFCSHASQFASTAMARGAPGEVLSRWRLVSRRSARRGISLIARRRQDRPQRRYGMGGRLDRLLSDIPADW